jgi:hypothetical protein
LAISEPEVRTTDGLDQAFRFRDGNGDTAYRTGSMTSMPHRLAAVLALAVSVATACGEPMHTDSAAPRCAATASKVPTTMNDPPNNLSTAGDSNGQSYFGVFSNSDGATSDGHGHWHTRIAEITKRKTSGDPAVIATFNSAIDAAAQGLIDQVCADTGTTASWNLDVKSYPTVKFRPSAITEVLHGIVFVTGAAHPVHYVSTVVADSRTAKPITLNTLFSNESRGLQRLSEQTKLIWPTIYGHGSSDPMPDQTGNQPREANFANWIPTAAGMEIHFADDQLGPGLPVITIPWPALTDVLAPNMTALTNP